MTRKQHRCKYHIIDTLIHKINWAGIYVCNVKDVSVLFSYTPITYDNKEIVTIRSHEGLTTQAFYEVHVLKRHAWRTYAFVIARNQDCVEKRNTIMSLVKRLERFYEC